MARRRTPATTRKGTKRLAAAAATAATGELGRGCTVIYVHGIGNKPIESVLKCQWDHALFGYDLGERSRLAYWVNRAYYPTPAAGTCTSGDVTEVENAPTGRAFSVEQHLENTPIEAEVDALTDDPKEKATLLRIVAKVEARGVPAQVRGVNATGIHGFILPLPRFLREWITRRITRAFARDVHDYLFVETRRDAMRTSLTERLEAGGGPFIVIAHSQGTMIAYDVLRRLPNLDIALFVTIGSPLGIQEVQDQLEKFDGKKALAVPTCVKRWLNVYDDDDPVAADEKISNDFLPKGRIEDVKIRNLESPAHPHSGTGYLRTDPVRHAVRDEVRVDLFQPVAPFTIARNLVRRLENAPREAQHPVLIELAQSVSDGDLTTKAKELAQTIRTLSGRSDEQLRLQIMRRYLAVDLTRFETEKLAEKFEDPTRIVKRIWRNEVKRALLETSLNAIHAGAAHVGYRAHGRDIAWAVLDSGINAAHPHFATHGNIVAQLDCTGRSVTEGSARDGHGHGTHVAGIIAGARAAGRPEQAAANHLRRCARDQAACLQGARR
ncbi:MAG TPA: S8 family serine peptidase [Vicinamibacterales bacterium]|nr:S8 family serine peptidase [Vicinamibacterales bacterium]